MRDLNGKEQCQLEGHLAPLALIREAVREVLREELAALRLPVGDGLLDVDAAARRLGLGCSTVRRLAGRCELASVKSGRRLLFKPADLDAYAEARRRSPERVRELAKWSGP